MICPRTDTFKCTRRCMATTGIPTTYVYDNLSIDSPQYGCFEDVRSVGMAVASVAQDGFDQ